MMRLLLSVVWFASMFGVVHAQVRLSAPAFTPMGKTAPAEETMVDGARAIRLPCNFAGTDIPRASWDVPWQVDLTRASGVELELRCDDTAPIGGFSVYFQSGDGWYAAASAIEPGKWVRVNISRDSTRVEGKPAGWSKVRTLRLSAWRGADRNTEILLRAVRSIEDNATIGVLRPESISETSEYASQMCSRIEELGLPYRLISDLDTSVEALRDLRVLVMPHTPEIRPEATASIAKWMSSGGKVLAFFSLPGEIASAGGLRVTGFKRQDKAGDFATIVAEEAFDTAPRKVAQRSWNITQSEPATPDAKVLARWHNDGGVPGPAAVVGSPRLIHMSHVMLQHDREGARQLLLAMLGRLDPAIWKETAERAIEQLQREASSIALSQPGAKDTLANALSKLESAREHLAAGRHRDAIAVANTGRDLVIEAYALDQQPKRGEWRGFWSHRAHGIDGEDWDTGLKRLKDNGFTAILPNMLWGGIAYYPSEYLPQAPEVKGGRDYIAECLAAGKKHGIEVHVWKVNFNMGGQAPAEFVQEMKSAGRTQVLFDGKPQDRWLCPSHPANQQLEIDAMVEVATKYDVDGIHFDYIRYPGPEGCFCGGCRERFQKAAGVTVKNWPAKTRNDPAVQEKWRQFRRDQITRVVQQVRERLAGRPDVKISAAVFSNWTSARNDVGQDWKLWCEKRYLDFVCPMDYTPSNAQFEHYVTSQLGWAAGVPIYPGIGLSTWTGAREDAMRTIEQIRIAREQGAPGFTIFEYDRGVAGSVLPLLGQGITKP